MKFLVLFIASLLVGLAASAPVSDDDKVIIDKDFYPDVLLKYTAEHDIVKLYVPLNNLNFEDDDENFDSDITLFFVEADIQTNGDYDYKGLYVLKKNEAKKLLDDGTSVAAPMDDSKKVYFGAKDGLYVYNVENNSADKYGSISDSIISLVKLNGSDTFYYVSEDHHLYKVTEEGTKKVKIDDVVGPKEIVIDFNDNLYYYGADKQPYVVNVGGAKKIEGLPENPSYVRLVKPPFIIEEGAIFLVDEIPYVIYANGTSEVIEDFQIKEKPTASAMEATLIQYYAHDKKIYEYNILTLILQATMESLKEFLEDKAEAIQTIATKPREKIRA